MGNEVDIFKNSNLPAYLKKDSTAALLAKFNASAMGGISGGSFSRISYRGSRWRIVANGEETALDSTTIEVAIVAANPAISKQFYAKAYEPGEDVAPDCYSNDGVRPEASAANKQSETCAECPKNKWGSKITQQGKEAKACADSKNIAVMPSNDLVTDVYAMKIPAASLKNLRTYVNELDKRGVPVVAVKTTLGFDSDASFPLLTFNVTGFFNEDEYKQILEKADSSDTEQVLGLVPQPNQQPAVKEKVEPEKQAEKPAETAQKDAEESPKASGFGKQSEKSSGGFGAQSEGTKKVDKAKAKPKAESKADTKSGPEESESGEDMSDLENELDDILASMSE